MKETPVSVVEMDSVIGRIGSKVLTDNGGEFANVSAFTHGLDGAAETDLFFCDPYQSSQKPKVKKITLFSLFPY